MRYVPIWVTAYAGGAIESREDTLKSLPAIPDMANRRLFIGGSDARIIMGPDEGALRSDECDDGHGQA